MGTVVNMQSLKQLSFLIFGLSICPLLVSSYGPPRPSSSGSGVSKIKQPDEPVNGNYWWMDTDAFGDGSDTQVKRTPSVGGGGSKNTQTVAGFPNNGGYPKNTGGFPQNAGGYPQNEVGYPQNGVDSPTNGQSVEKIQDNAGGICPTGLICVSESQCKQSGGSVLQERVANYIPCSPNKICCGKSPIATDPFTGSGSSPSSSSIFQQDSGNFQLPETQCSAGYKCVSDLFCDATGTMVQFRVELTQAERRNRGKLTPCMNPNTQQFDVCCRKPVILPAIENNEVDKFQRQELKPTTCPVINILPPIEQCQGRPSNCWSVGVEDTDCIGNALCCFDGCANVCQGEGPIKGNPGPQSNARGQQRQQPLKNANTNFNSNKPEAFQELTQPAINQEFGASSTDFETIKKRNPTGYVGQQLPTQKQPLLLSIQKQQPLSAIPAQNPLNSQPVINTIPNEPIINNVQNPQEYNGAIVQFAPENSNSFGDTQDYPTLDQPQTSPANYPNTQKIVFPNDEEETSFPTFSQTSVPSFIDQSPSNLESAQTQYPSNPPQLQVIQPNPTPAQQSVQNAASQPFVTCPSAMKCVQKINCNFNGVMVEEQVLLTPEQETQRVPLIPCFNAARSNAVDVCCRDPNYKDPWPNSQNGNGQQQEFNLAPKQEEQVSGLFQESPSSTAPTSIPKKRRTNAYGK